MIDRGYRTVDVPVEGGSLRVGIWDAATGTDAETKTNAPADADATAGEAASALLVHGVTSSHLAWPFVVDELPGVRLIAPDLRGRGRSNGVIGPAGMRAHAADLAAVLDHLGIERTVVVAHSMGAFVAVVFAHLYPERVSRLVLIDGGLPLDVPVGLDPDTLVSHILGPTAARLSMRFGDAREYLDFWRAHPAFRADWSPELEEYLAYDLVPDGTTLRPATSYETTLADTIDMNTGSALPEALAGLRHPVLLLTVPRGLQDEEPGLYAPAYLSRMLERFSSVRHVRLDGLNHYTIVLSKRGATEIGSRISEELAAVD